MTSRAGTVLSDEHIMKHCSIYKPIPMGMTKSILHQNLNLHTQSPYTVKKLKYHNAVSRPATFDTLAKTLTRITKDDSMRENLKSMYIKEINAPRSTHVSVPPSVHTPPQMTGPASIVPRSTLALPQPIPFPDPNLPTGFPAPPFQPLPDSENENGNGSEYSNGNGTASTASDPEVRFPEHHLQDELATRATIGTPMTFPKLDEDEYRRRASTFTFMNADARARQEAYADPEIAARAETTQGAIVLRNRAIQSPFASQEERVERAMSAFNRRDERLSVAASVRGLEVNSPAYMEALERAESPGYNTPEYNRMMAQAAGASGLNY